MTLTFMTAEDVRDDILTNLPNTYQKTIGTDFWEWSFAVGKASLSLWDKIKYICSWSDLRNLNLEDMAHLVYQLRGISHRSATYSVGVLTLTGSDTVTTGDIFQTADGLQFKATETKAITTSGTVNAECLTAGAIGNVPVGQITKFVTYKGNFTAVTNAGAFSGGYEAETKDELWERYIEDVSNPVTSGNAAHYRKWALEVAGVGNAKVKPLWNGDNTVKVVITGNDGLPASSSLVNTVQQYIDPYVLVNGIKSGWGCGNGKAPIGAYCTVTAATQKNIVIVADVDYADGSVKSVVDAEITANINKYLKNIAFKQNYVSYSKIDNAISSAENVLDVYSLTVNGGTSNIALTDNNLLSEVPVLTSITLS